MTLDTSSLLAMLRSRRSHANHEPELVANPGTRVRSAGNTLGARVGHAGAGAGREKPAGPDSSSTRRKARTRGNEAPRFRSREPKGIDVAVAPVEASANTNTATQLSAARACRTDLPPPSFIHAQTTMVRSNLRHAPAALPGGGAAACSRSARRLQRLLTLRAVRCLRRRSTRVGG